MVELGPFRLQSPLGQGGMGEVWSGVHVHSDRPVAVKVLRAERARNPLFQAALRREIRAVAGLDHPRVVQVLAHGEVGPGVGGGDLVPGTPYLVMELADGPSLARCLPLGGWEPAREALLALLEALAHAHGRALLHRDIKPENILGFWSGGRLYWKLADFGVAQILGQPSGGRALGLGTPATMAPEQVAGQEAEHGPWTDLYAVGCVAWQLVTGAPPYQGEAREVMQAHRQAPLPAFRPRFPVPEDLHDWLCALLEKDPRDRPEFAADAAAGLTRLSAALTASEHAAGAEVEHGDSSTYAFTMLDALGAGPPPAEEQPTPVPRSRAIRKRPTVIGAPFSEAWERPEPPSEPTRRLSSGAELLDLRPIPMVGRDPERAQLWRELGRARAGQPRVVALVGPAGAGRSRLLQWLCERVVELGAARPALVLVQPEGGGLSQALAAALRGALGHLPADADRLEERLLPAAADAEEARVLARLLAGLPPAALLPREQRALWLRALRLIAEDRPVVLALDDAELDPEALDLALHLAEHGQGLPLLIALTLRSDRLAQDPTAEARLASMRRLGTLARVAVEPLPRELRRGLLRRLLGLSADLVAVVDERSAGLPRLAVELVRRWAAEGHLVAHADGLALVGDPRPEGDPTQEWQDIARALCGGDPPPALEIAAVLGPEVNAGEWAAACTFGGCSPCWDLVEQLMDRSLLSPARGRGWAFSQRLLHQAILTEATRSGRAVAWTQAAVRALQLSPRSDPARLGMLLLRSGDAAAAYPPLRQAADAASQSGDYMRALWLLGQAGEALDQLDAPEEDPRRVQLLVARVRQRCESDAEGVPPAEVEALLRRVEASGQVEGLPSLHLAHGMTLRRVGRLPEAERALAHALTLAREAPDPAREVMYVHSVYTLVLRNLGKAPQAREGAEEMLAAATRLGNVFYTGWAIWLLGWLDRAAGEDTSARARLEQARALAREQGYGVLQAAAAMELAELDRKCGRQAEAEQGYREASRLWGAGGYGEALLAELNLANMLLDREDYAGALQMLRPLLYSTRVAGHAYRMGVLHMLLALAMAGLGSWPGVDQHLAVTDRFLRESGYSELDFALSAERLGRMALAAGEPERARRALDLAALQRRALGQPDHAAALEAEAVRA